MLIPADVIRLEVGKHSEIIIDTVDAVHLESLR